MTHYNQSKIFQIFLQKLIHNQIQDNKTGGIIRKSELKISKIKTKSPFFHFSDKIKFKTRLALKIFLEFTFLVKIVILRTKNVIRTHYYESERISREYFL